MLEQVRAVLAKALNLKSLAVQWDADTLLLGNLPELDSLAVINVITTLEETFDIQIYDDEVSGDVFATLGTLSDFVAAKVEAAKLARPDSR